jgi:uncharacterized protein YoxC
MDITPVSSVLASRSAIPNSVKPVWQRVDQAARRLANSRENRAEKSTKSKSTPSNQARSGNAQKLRAYRIGLETEKGVLDALL